jgi:hypothetical protein
MVFISKVLVDKTVVVSSFPLFIVCLAFSPLVFDLGVVLGFTASVETVSTGTVGDEVEVIPFFCFVSPISSGG